jgi:hypothetical protein
MSAFENIVKEGIVSCTRIVSLLVIGLTAACCLQTLPASAEGTFQRSLQVEGPAIIELSTGAGTVNVRSGNSDQVLVTGRVRVSNWFGSEAQQAEKRISDNPPIKQSANEIRIGHLANIGLLHNVSISYDLIVPAGTRFRSHSGADSQNLAAASLAAVFLMLIVNVMLFRRNQHNPVRAA